jgi:chromate transporter
MVPLIREEIVENRHFITEQQFVDYVALGDTLPGPIATKLSIIIGMDTVGYLGAFVALLGILLPSSIAIILLFGLLDTFKDSPFVKGMQVAVKPVVVVLIAGVALSIARATVFPNFDFSTSKGYIIMGLLLGSTIIILLNEYVPGFNVHPAFVIVASLLIGGFFIK